MRAWLASAVSEHRAQVEAARDAADREEKEAAETREREATEARERKATEAREREATEARERAEADRLAYQIKLRERGPEKIDKPATRQDWNLYNRNPCMHVCANFMQAHL